MMLKVSRRVYYRVTLELLSALSIGAADSIQTDSDLILDGRGLPTIPATSLCGALRSYLEAGVQQELFGGPLPGRGAEEGCVRVYDASFVEGSNAAVSIRDNVSLRHRVPVEGLKFDREVANKGAQFRTLIEVVLDEDAEEGSYDEAIHETLGKSHGVERTLESLLSALHAGEIRLGAKKTRGMGRVSVPTYEKKEFDLFRSDGPDSPLEAWLKFDPFDDASWKGSAALTPTEGTGDAGLARIVLTLSQAGGVSVREYTTEPESYDYSQAFVHVSKAMIDHDDGEELGDTPVIPGTSWAGAFRERYASFAGGDGSSDLLFGKVDRESSRKSLITFEESLIEGGSWETYTRVAIDRFTGGVLEGPYTQRSYYGGTTDLAMTIRLKYEVEAEGTGTRFEKLRASDFVPLIAAFADLHNGFLAVGGMASVGHGLFRIDRASLHVGTQDRSDEFSKVLLKPLEEGSPFVEPDLEAAARLITRVDSQEA